MYCNVHCSAEIASVSLRQRQISDKAPFSHLRIFGYDAKTIYVSIQHGMWSQNAPSGALFE